MNKYKSNDETKIKSNICIIQADNRPSLNYLLLTQKINKKFCDYLGYDYLFIEIDNSHNHLHPATKKIYVVHDFLQNINQNKKYDILVFLDSDAWIQDPNWLNDIIINLASDDKKHGSFSRDPYVKHNTFINSGSFILKINDFTLQMYKNIIDDLHNDSTFYNRWPFDQYYISNCVFENKDNFNIFVPDIINTPFGKVIRHNWLKNGKMYDDLDKLILLTDEDIVTNKIPFNIEEYYDHEIFPNIHIHGYEYFE
jgi:hypothetical protein